MKRTILILLAAVAMISCCKQAQESPTKHAKWAYNSVIYELNTRQFTPEGTFAAATEQLYTLRQLGVDIIWIMPIQPIGVEGRKGMLGSYYSIQDYCAFNPEFGTREDFDKFLKEAHDLGMYVILDWVANHTSRDAVWTVNEGWHYRDSETGELMVQYDWTDIAKLNYDNQDMRAEMLKSLRWWVDSIGIDGFRCDVASEIPTDFWEWAFADIRKDHPALFTLAEAEFPEENVNAFDMYYGWELHHIMNQVAQGHKNVEDLWAYFAKADTMFVDYAIRMNFTSNHDENSWAGTEFERMGTAAHTFAAFTYIIPGMPLIYCGQEFGNNHRLLFFEKDCIDVNDGKEFVMYQNLNNLRHANKALNTPELGSTMVRIDCDNSNIFACTRQAEDNTVVAVFNFSAQPQNVTLQTAGLEGEYNLFGGKQMDLASELTLTLEPWQYIILSK